MEPDTMRGMQGSVTQIPRGRPAPGRPRRHARRPSAEPERPTGRAWINGREVGGPDPRYAHLTCAYD